MRDFITQSFPHSKIITKKIFVIVLARFVQALFLPIPEEGHRLHNPLVLFQSDENPRGPFFLTVNDLFLMHGYNPLYFSRNSILRIREIKTGNQLPRNKQAVSDAG